MFANDPDRLLHVLRETILTTVRRDGADLTIRELAVLLTAYLTNGPHTVSSLSADLNISKTAIFRALARLGELDLTRRTPDLLDGRSLVVERSAAGRIYLHDLEGAMTAAMYSEGPQAAVAA